MEPNQSPPNASLIVELRDAAKPFAFAIVIIAIVVTLVGGSVSYAKNLGRMPQGAVACLRHVADKYPALLDSAVVTSSMWTRSLDKHWIAALVFSPKNFEDTLQVTIVCHFAGRSFAFDSVRSTTGDRIDALKRLSASHLDPLMVFEGSGYSGFDHWVLANYQQPRDTLRVP